MRTSTVVLVVILVVVIVGGVLTSQGASTMSERYVSASRELLVLTEDGQWERSAQLLSDYQHSWEESLHWLQMLINHEDTDDVTLAMTKIEAGVRRKDAALCALGCNELQEAARHIYHRDAFTLANIL